MIENFEDNMVTQELPKLTTQELYERGAINFSSVVITTLDFLKLHQISIREYVQYVGTRFAVNWSTNLTPFQLAEEMALHFMSVGAKIEDLAGDENESQFVMTDWPPDEMVSQYSAKREEVDQFVELTLPIAEHQNCTFAMQRQGDRLVCKFTRKA